MDIGKIEQLTTHAAPRAPDNKALADAIAEADGNLRSVLKSLGMKPGLMSAARESILYPIRFLACLAVESTASDFCRYCGASIPPREGEGRCEKCMGTDAPTGKVIGTCGHSVDGMGPDGMGYSAIVKDRDREGNRCVSYGAVCRKCLDFYEDEGMVLEPDEVKTWMAASAEAEDGGRG